jgi:hypothetical protein
VVNALKSEFDDEIAFVLANLQTHEGQAFASQHGVPNTTLVFLDANGERLEILRGTQDRNELRAEIKRIFDLPR